VIENDRKKRPDLIIFSVLTAIFIVFSYFY
jgi:hypothetical protein